MDVFVGGANGVPGHATKGTLRIQGGSFLGRTLTTGVGWGAKSVLAIEGSKASAVHVLDYVYIQGFADREGNPGISTLLFTIDDQGVTPITIQSHRRGLRIIKDALSHCRLEIRLSAVPPREDVTLVSGHVPIQGTFDNLPEGSEIEARYQGRMYRWQLTYHGGKSGDDLVLKNQLRVRVGDDDVRLEDRKSYQGGAGEHAVYFTDGSANAIADHLSLSWSTTKILSVTKMSDRITIQWCILSEALNFAAHGYASLAGGNRVTWHHNLFAHNLSRNVRFQGPVDADFRNNLIYDWGDTAAYGEFDRVNYIGNFLKAGPSTTQKPWLLFHNGDAVVMPDSLFVTNNILQGRHAAPGVNRDNWRGMGYYYERNTVAASEAFPAPPVATESPQAAYEDVLKNAGATLPRRDAVDERIVREVRDGTGHIINWVKEAGGWPDFPSVRASSSGSQ